MKKEATLIIVDMQNDFIDGVFSNADAQRIVEPIVDLMCGWDGNIILTRDTHQYNYLDTPEGKKLPIRHCVQGTEGWCVHDAIMQTVLALLGTNGVPCDFIDKSTFGYIEWREWGNPELCDDIYIVGTCTDICVISNALILKAMFPEKNITVISDLCAGTTTENHEAALNVMRSCQVDVISEEEFRNMQKE